MFKIDDFRKFNETKNEKDRNYPLAAKTLGENLAAQIFDMLKKQRADLTKYILKIKENVVSDNPTCQTHFEHNLPSLKRIQDWLDQACTEFAKQHENNIFTFDFATAGKILTEYADICLALALEYDIPDEKYITGYTIDQYRQVFQDIEREKISKEKKQEEYYDLWSSMDLFYRIRFPATLERVLANFDRFLDPYVHPFRGTRPYYESEQNRTLQYKDDGFKEGRLGIPEDLPNFSFD